MIRKLLATTALSVIVTAGAAHAAGMKADEQKTDNAQTPIFQTSPKDHQELGVNGYLESQNNQVLASTMIGKSIYTGTGEDAESVGDVDDIVLSESGQAEAIVVGVGGFLGIGEKEVAISFDRVNMVTVGDEMRLTINATKEDLENAPAFDRDTITDQMKSTYNDAKEGVTEGYESAKASVKKTYNDAKASISASMNDMTDHDKVAEGANEQKTAVKDEAMASSDEAVPAPDKDMKKVEASTLSTDELIGTTVHSADKRDIGEVSDVILSKDKKGVEAYIVDVGGFLGIDEKPMAFGADELSVYKDGDGDMHIYTHYTEDALKQKPEYSKQAYAKNPDDVVLR